MGRHSPRSRETFLEEGDVCQPPVLTKSLGRQSKIAWTKQSLMLLLPRSMNSAHLASRCFPGSRRMSRRTSRSLARIVASGWGSTRGISSTSLLWRRLCSSPHPSRVEGRPTRSSRPWQLLNRPHTNLSWGRFLRQSSAGFLLWKLSRSSCGRTTALDTGSRHWRRIISVFSCSVRQVTSRSSGHQGVTVNLICTPIAGIPIRIPVTEYVSMIPKTFLPRTGFGFHATASQRCSFDKTSLRRGFIFFH